MKTIIGVRASSILYDLLTKGDARPFLLPANVCPIVPLTFLKAGVPYEFVDISPDTLHMDLDQVRERLSTAGGGYGGLVYVHTYGDPVTPNYAFLEIKQRHPRLLLIDDRCLCVPELQPDPRSAADVLLYSTGYAKIVDLGFGGYAFLRDQVDVVHRRLPYKPEALRRLERDYKKAIEIGRPYTYIDTDWLETDAELPSWAQYTERIRGSLSSSLEQRRCINAIYDAVLPTDMRLPANYQLWRYNIRVKDNRKTLAAIIAGRLFASSHYASLAGIFGPGAGSNAAKLASQAINLFNDHHYTPEMAERTAQLVLGSL